MVDKRTDELMKSKLALEVEINERKKTEILLKQSEELFRSIFDHSAVGVCLIDFNGKLLEVNDSFTELSGYTRDELTTMQVSDIVSANELKEIIIDIEKLAKREILNLRVERVFENKSKGKIFADIWLSTIHDEYRNANALIATVVDITEKKKIQATLLETRQIKVANQLAGAIAHEFNNPLAIVQLATEMAEIDKIEDPQKRQQLSKIPPQIDRMSNLVKKLLNLRAIKEKEYADGAKILDLHNSEDSEN